MNIKEVSEFTERVAKKLITECFECNQFPCIVINTAMETAIELGKPYLEAIDDLELIRE